MHTSANHVVLMHGYAAAADSQWLPWLHEKLEERGLHVTALSMPQPLKPNFKTWMKRGKIIAATLTPQTVIVAHSLGAAFLMRVLASHARVKVRAVILVSPIYASLVSVKPLLAFFDRPIDWAVLRAAAGDFEVIHAKNDPLIPFDHGLRYAESLGANMRLLPSGGHLNRREFPLLLRTVMSYVAK